MKNLNIKYLILLSGALILLLQPAKAQQKFNEEFDIVKPYKPKLSDAVKIDVIPEKELAEAKKPDMKFTTPPFLFPTTPFKAKLKSVGIGSVPLEDLNRAFVKAGFGNYTNLYLEAFYNSLRSKDLLYTAHGKWNTGNGPVKNSGFTESFIDLNGKKIFKKNILEANIGYRNDNLHYYGYDHDSLDFNKDSIKQNFSDFYLNGSFNNDRSDTGAFKYSLGAAYYYFSDRFKSNENDVTLFATAAEPFMGNNILFKSSFDYINYKALNNYSRTILKIDVGYKFGWETIRAYAGFKTANETDSGSSYFHFYPDVNLETNIFEQNLIAFGGMTGDLQKNTFKSFARENQFIQSVIDIKNTNKKFDLYGGLKGSINASTSYLASLSYQTFNNMYFYMNDSVDTKRFLPVYDNPNTGLIKLHGETGFLFSDELSFSLGANYYKYSMSSLEKPFHRPTVDAVLTGKYNLQNKIIIGADIFAFNIRAAKVLGADATEIRNLKGAFDVNTFVTYRFNKNFSFFIELKNILGTKYNIWNYYDVRGFQVMGGLKISFLPENNN